jgi:acyl-CoA thioesterase-1
MTSRSALVAAGVGVVLQLACGSSGDRVDSAASEAARPAPASAPSHGEARASTDAPAPVAARRIVFLGDSLTAGLGLPLDQAYPSLIQERLDARSAGWTVVNAGVSGDTSAGGLRRLDWSLGDGAAVIVVALGANDGLRGLPVDDLRRNLDTIVERAQAAGTRVILAGMEAPPNNGPEYAAAFRRIYPEIATARGVALVPFLLAGVAGVDTLNQADGIHPNQEGARRVADLVWQALEPIVTELETQSTR